MTNTVPTDRLAHHRHKDIPQALASVAQLFGALFLPYTKKPRIQFPVRTHI